MPTPQERLNQLLGSYDPTEWGDDSVEAAQKRREQRVDGILGPYDPSEWGDVEPEKPPDESRIAAAEEELHRVPEQRLAAYEPALRAGPTTMPAMQPTTGAPILEEPRTFDEKVRHYREMEEIMLNLASTAAEREEISRGTDDLIQGVMFEVEALEEPWIDPTFAGAAGGGMGARLAMRTATGIVSNIGAALSGGVRGTAGAALGEFVSAPFVERLDSPALKFAANVLFGGLTEGTANKLFDKAIKQASPEDIQKVVKSLKDALRAESKRATLPGGEARKVEAYTDKLDQVNAFAEREILLRKGEEVVDVPPRPVPLVKDAEGRTVGQGFVPKETAPKKAAIPTKEVPQPTAKVLTKGELQTEVNTILQPSKGEGEILPALGAGEAEKTINILSRTAHWWSNGPGLRLTRFFQRDLPQWAGSKNETIDNLNYWFLTDYKREGFSEEWRDAIRKGMSLQHKAMDFANEIKKFTSGEQRRIAQIIEGSITGAPQRYNKVLEVAREFAQLKKDLTELRLLSQDTIFDAIPPAERSKLMRKLYGGTSPKKEGGKYVQGVNEKIAKMQQKIERTADKNAQKTLRDKLTKLHNDRGEIYIRLAKHYPLKAGTAQLTEKQLRQSGIQTPLSEGDFRRLIFHPPTTTGKKYLTRRYLQYEGQVFEENPVLKHVFPAKRGKMQRWYRQRRRALSPEMRKELGQIEEAAYPVGKGLAAQYYDRELGTFYKRVALNPEWATHDPAIAAEKGWEKYQITSDKLGALKGAYVQPEIYRDLRWVNPVLDSDFMKQFDKWMSVWKFMKVPADPAAQFRNTLSNTVLADMGGVPQWNIPAYMQNVVGFARKDELYQEMLDHAMFGKEWANIEIGRFADMDKDLRGAESGFDIIQSFIKRTADSLTGVYQANEIFFKSLLYRHNRKLGKGIQESIDEAQHYVFDYSAIPPAVQILKRFYSPFITFTWKALPVVAETTVRKPWKIAKYMLMYEGLKRYAINKFGWSEEEAEKNFNSLPEYMTKLLPGAGRSHWLQPWGSYVDDEGELHAKMFDANYIFPGTGDILEVWGQSGLPFRPLWPNHPVIDILIAANTQTIPFTGRELTTEFEQKMKNKRLRTFLKTGDIGQLSFWTKNAKYVGNVLFPSLTPFVGRSYDKIVSAVQQEQDMFGNERTLPSALVDVFFGLRFRDVVFSQARARKVMDNMRYLQDIRRTAIEKVRDIQSRTFSDDPAKDDEIKEEKVLNVRRTLDNDINVLKEELDKIR